MKRALVVCALFAYGLASAEPAVYDMDPSHTYPSFEGDHMAGLSTWRGKFNKTTGKITLDRAAGTGMVEATIDLTSVDFGHDEMNAHATSAEFFDEHAESTELWSPGSPLFQEPDSVATLEEVLQVQGRLKAVLP